MNRWQKIESLFRGALEQPFGERDAWLRKSCGSDSDLLREVGMLVSNHRDEEPGTWAAAGAAQLILRSAAAARGHVGHYELLECIGVGGMGQVYRARDSKLRREVALKLLPTEFAEDPECLARFTREAQVLASLNHPNIAAIYGVEDGAIVMELVDGSTLAEHIAAARPSGQEVLVAMRQVAEALEYAHDKGIVHRDLKPPNIKVTPEGRVKLLDFGLARALSHMPAGSRDFLTITDNLTMPGAIMGSAAYMPPEQARGATVDKRADIWSFGVILYECVTGRHPFAEETVQETLAAVLKTEPDWTALPRDTEPSIRRLMRRCLARDPRQRLRDIGDAITDIDEALTPGPADSLVKSSDRGGRKVEAVLGVAGLLALALLGTSIRLWQLTSPVEHSLIRLKVELGPDAIAGTSTTVVISRDGRRLVFPARGPDGKRRLATRLLDEPEPALLTGSEDASDPFFSPDGEWVGFFADGHVKKISVHGGAPVVICDSVNPRGASWDEDHGIVAALNLAGPLSRVPDTGSAPPKPLTTLRSGEASHRWPQVLPGGKTVLFTTSANPIGHDNDNIEAVSLSGGQVKVLLHGAYYGRYVPSGHLLYVHQGLLYGVRFDPDRLEVRGRSMPLKEDVGANSLTGAGQFDVSGALSGTGTMVYMAGVAAAQRWRVEWLDSSGNSQPLIAQAGVYTVPRVSPDGKKLAFIGADSLLQIYDVERESSTRITSITAGGNLVWAPDGRHLAFGFAGHLYWIRSDGAGDAQRILESQHAIAPWSFSPDGHRLAYFETTSDTGADIGVISLDAADADHPKVGGVQPFLRTSGDELLPVFSPDGQWIAYKSDESGRAEISVRPFPPGNEGRTQVSTGGGRYPLWSRTGHHLFYETLDNRMMVVDYGVDGGIFRAQKARVWSDHTIFDPGVSNVDIAPDGKRFVVLALPQAATGEGTALHATMLLNYFDELKRRIP